MVCHGAEFRHGHPLAVIILRDGGDPDVAIGDSEHRVTGLAGLLRTTNVVDVHIEFFQSEKNELHSNFRGSLIALCITAAKSPVILEAEVPCNAPYSSHGDGFYTPVYVHLGNETIGTGGETRLYYLLASHNRTLSAFYSPFSASSINLVNSFWKNSRTVPTGPFLCLATMTSAMFLSGVSSS